jgi:hypothetical protein
MSCPDGPALLRHVEGLAAPEEREDVAAHVAACAPCREAGRGLEGAIDALCAAAPQPGSMTERIRRIESRFVAPGRAQAWLPLAAAVLLAGGLVALAVWKAPAPDPGAPSPADTSPKEGEPLDPLVDGRRLRAGGRPEEIAAVSRALGWLTKRADADGGWGNPGLTGLALMAYSAAGAKEGATPAMRAGRRWLLARQGRAGEFEPRANDKWVYHHAIATWALADLLLAKAVAAADREATLEALKKAAKLLADARNPGAGWRYGFRPGDSDASVTFWAASALAVARRAGADVPKESLEGAVAMFDQFTADGRTGYTSAGTGKVMILGANDGYDHHEALTGASLAVRALSGVAGEADHEAGLKAIAADRPDASKAAAVDFYYWHAAALGLRLREGRRSETWQGWWGACSAAILKLQKADGSWEGNDRWGVVLSEDERAVYAAAMNALTLATPWRYATGERRR